MQLETTGQVGTQDLCRVSVGRLQALPAELLGCVGKGHINQNRKIH